MPKMVRWDKLEGKDIPPTFREAEAVYKDTESIFYLGNFDRSNRSAIEQRWKVMDKEGVILKGQYNCCGFRLYSPPTKWASKVVDNKREVSNGDSEEEGNEEEFKYRNYDAPVADEDDEEPVKIRKKKDRKAAIIEAIQEEAIRPSEPPEKRGRGRPPGSKNKPKTGQPLTVKKKRKKRRKL